LKAFRAVGEALPGGFEALSLEVLLQPGQVRHPLALFPNQWFLSGNTPDDLRVLDEAIAGRGRR